MKPIETNTLVRLLSGIDESLRRLADQFAPDTRHDRNQGTEQSLERLEQLIIDIGSRLQSNGNHAIEKEFYTVNEVASRTQSGGVASYAAWTIRQACNSGRIAEAQRGQNRQWRIPHAALLQILQRGLATQDGIEMAMRQQQK